LSFWQVEVPNSILYDGLNTLNKLVFFDIDELPKRLDLEANEIVYIRTKDSDNIPNKSFYPGLYHLLYNSKNNTTTLALAGVDNFKMHRILTDTLKKLEVTDRVIWGRQNKRLGIKSLELHVDINNPPAILFRLRDPEQIVLHLSDFNGILPNWLTDYEHICNVQIKANENTLSQFLSIKEARCH
jgi:hypothetical protein